MRTIQGLKRELNKGIENLKMNQINTLEIKTQHSNKKLEQE
jgi:hypothetical protein